MGVVMLYGMFPPGEALLHGRGQIVIELHQHQPAHRAFQVIGKRALPRPDLQHLVLGSRFQGRDDLPLQVRIDEEVLPQGLLRPVRAGHASTGSGCIIRERPEPFGRRPASVDPPGP